MSATIDWDALLGSTEPPASTDPTDQNDNGNDDHPVSTFETPSPADDTGIPNTTPTDLGTVSTAPSPSLYDLTSTAIDSAPPTPPGQTGRPLTAEERLFQEQNPNGGSFTNPQAGVSVGGNGRPMTVEEQNASKQLPNGGSISATGVLSPNPAGPQLPNPGVGTASTSSTSGTASTGTTGSGSDRFVRDAQGNITGVKSENGYYDPNFQSVTNMENNYQRGDRMAGTVQGLELLAGAGNQDAAKILGADKRNGSNFMDSALEADWAKAHNAEIGNTLAGMTGKNANQAAADNLRGQLAPVNATPGTTGQDFPMAQKMMTDLEKVPGVQPNSVTMDKYGNVVFQDQGGIRHIPANEWADWAPVIAGKVAGADTTTDPTPPGATNTPSGGGNSRNAAPSRQQAPQPSQQASATPASPYDLFPTTNTPTGEPGQRNNRGTLRY